MNSRAVLCISQALKSKHACDKALPRKDSSTQTLVEELQRVWCYCVMHGRRCMLMQNAPEVCYNALVHVAMACGLLLVTYTGGTAAVCLGLRVTCCMQHVCQARKHTVALSGNAACV